MNESANCGIKNWENGHSERKGRLSYMAMSPTGDMSIL